jgi:hypothetical protein
VAQVGCGLGLATESGNEVLISGELRVEDLDRDLPAEEKILGAKHIAHPAPGKVADEPISL